MSLPLRLDDDVVEWLWDHIDSKHKTLSAVIRGLIEEKEKTDSVIEGKL